MRILAIERPADGSPGEPSACDLRDEAARAWELLQQDSLREIYLTDRHSRAVILLECANAAAAEALLETLPLVERGFITFDVMELEPYPGFARLFADRT
jgi:muconolactone delta-isomerase